MLVERTEFLTSLAGLRVDALAGAGRMVFLGGEAGIGKTSLVNALAGELSGTPMRRGGCDNVTTPAALGPLLEAVPELGDTLDAGTRVDLLRLFRALRDVLVAQPCVLVFEDVHWADEATLDMLRVIARRLDQLPALLVATFRADELRHDHPLTALLGDIATLPGVLRMQLPALSPAGVQQLVAAAGSLLDPAVLHRDTAGNPFYVTEVLATNDTTVPPSVRDAVLARAHRLPPGARRVLDTAAVLGPRSEVRLLLELAGQPAAALDECIAHGVLLDEAGTTAFRHELARRAIEQALAPSERTAVHAAALTALRTARPADDRRIAHHAAACGDSAAVLAHASAAGAHAARLGAHREAAELFRLALHTGEATDTQRMELCASLSYECYLTDQMEDAYVARLEAMQLAEQAGDSLTVGTSQRWLSRLAWFSGRNEESEQWAVRAIATLEPHSESSELAMAYSNLAQLRMLANDTAEAVRLGERAVALAHFLGARDVEIHALNNVGTAQLSSGNEIEGRHRLARSLDLALAADAQEHAARAYTNLGTAAVAHRQFAEAERHLGTGVDYCMDRDLDSWRLYMSAWLAFGRAEQGRYDAAERAVADVLSRAHLSPITRITASVVAAQLAMRRGQPSGELLDTARELAASTRETQRLVPVACAGAEAAWLDGRFDDVGAQVDFAWADVLRHPDAWALGELSWWLAVAGERRPSPIALPAPFQLLLDGHWREAATGWQALGCPLWAAHALGRSPELDDARTALEIVDGLAAPAVRDALLRDRHAAGLPVPRGPRQASRSNAWGLTAREVEILGLLTGGLSNAELASRLYLSEKTVGHHVSAILRKMGEPTRSRAVALAVQHGIGAN